MPKSTIVRWENGYVDSSQRWNTHDYKVQSKVSLSPAQDDWKVLHMTLGLTIEKSFLESGNSNSTTS